MRPAPHQRQRILVVDDDDAKRYTIAHPLRSHGMLVEEAASAAQALEQARRDPDLIILDVKLPDGDGFEVCEKLKKDPVTASIPVLYVSAVFRTPEDRVRGLRGGADGYLVTPINRDELVATVEVWLRVRSAERDRRRLLVALDRERAFLEQVIEQLPLGVIIAEGPSGRLLFFNTVAKAMYGPQLEEIGSVAAYSSIPLVRSDGQPLSPEEYPLARALRGEHVRASEARELLPDGARILSTNASPVTDQDGTIVGGVLVFEDVSARRRDEEQLRAIGQLREELIGIIGHDLRNPIQAIKMSLRMLESAALPYRQQNAVTRIHNSTERMRRLIDDMVDFASARLGGGLNIRPVKEVDLGEVLGDVLDELRHAHPNRAVLREGEERLVGRWDPDRLAQVVSNLIGNALQHSPPESKVTVRLRQEGTTAVLEVHNPGKPIPAEDLQSVFTPFRRGANADVAGRSVGLGLYISHQVMLAHGGRITVRSTAEEGTTFRVTLPL